MMTLSRLGLQKKILVISHLVTFLMKAALVQEGSRMEHVTFADGQLLLLAIDLGHVQTRWPLRVSVYQTYKTSGTHCSRPVETHLSHVKGLHGYE
ncbi:hypothetical protein EDD22DRAFT_163454 [Suillus occidentalis]|nr:hypothetical protein EDD22DRAFT_163454 [Suillus occidentalis]